MAFKPYVMKNVDLILGDEATGANYRCQIRSVVLAPSMNIVKIKTACPEGQFADAEDPEWELQLGYVYGMDTATETLADFLMEHAGKHLPFTFRPIAGGAGYAGEVTVIPGGIGGNYGAASEQSVNLPLDGQPRKIAAITTP